MSCRRRSRSLALLLSQKRPTANAAVTVVHTGVPDWPEYTRRAGIVVAAAGGQPADTLAALLSRAGGRLVDQWWQAPADLFAPPELAGPF